MGAPDGAAGIDLLTGHVHGQVVPRHRSREFVAFLRTINSVYPTETKIEVVLDNHSAHTSQETRAYLKTVPNRFEFIFTPKHGSWLNIIELFSSKMARTLLRGIRVASQEELRSRIEQYLREVNEAPIPFRWKYGLDELTDLSGAKLRNQTTAISAYVERDRLEWACSTA